MSHAARCTLTSAKFCGTKTCIPALFLLLVPSLCGQSNAAKPQQPGVSHSASLSAPADSVPRAQDEAWILLTTAAEDTKHPDLQVQGLAALGLLGSNPRSLKLIEDAMGNHDVDVRTAAALAAAQTRSNTVTTGLRRMLDDKDPSVAFAAAIALWKMGDRSGEDILLAVADGERSATPGAFNSATHAVNRELHHPGTLARFGVMQGAGILLGPFGFGLSAYEYLHKNGGDGARITAIDALAQNHTAPIRRELLAALVDKDPGVRATACKALSSYRDPEVAHSLVQLFNDPRAPVRLTAAAAYLLSSLGTRPAGPKRKTTRLQGSVDIHAAGKTS